MTPKEKRERLFRKSRPNIRAMEFYDNSSYHKDIKLLWVAHQHKPFYGLEKGISQEEFARTITNFDAELLMIDDENNQYSATGPVGMIIVYSDSWRIEPHAAFFPWATKKNILRSAVAFFQWARNSRKIGCVLIFVLEEGKNLYDRVCEYGVLNYIGKLVNGNERGHEYLYSVKGKRR